MTALDADREQRVAVLDTVTAAIAHAEPAPTPDGLDGRQPSWITMLPERFAGISPVAEVRVWHDSAQLVAYLHATPAALLWWIDPCWRHEPVRCTWTVNQRNGDIAVTDDQDELLFDLPNLKEGW